MADSFLQSLRSSVLPPSLVNLREPFFVSNPYLALPWITPAKQPFVLHLNYPFDRAAGIKMESGGIGGLIDRGYFATLALDKGRKGRFDGSNLKRYRSRPGVCAGLILFDRVNGPKPVQSPVSRGRTPKS